MFSYSLSFCNNSILAGEDSVWVFKFINGRKLSFSNIDFLMVNSFGNSSGAGLVDFKKVPQPEKIKNRYKISNIFFNLLP